MNVKEIEVIGENFQTLNLFQREKETESMVNFTDNKVNAEKSQVNGEKFQMVSETKMRHGNIFTVTIFLKKQIFSNLLLDNILRCSLLPLKEKILINIPDNEVKEKKNWGKLLKSCRFQK